jgi:hypothetical protein
MKKISFLSMNFFLLIACGGGSDSFTPLKKPVSINLSVEDITYNGKKTRFAYVADQFAQALVVIDTQREEIVDTAPNDDFDFTPIPIGGEPTAVVVDNGVSPHRIFTADQLNNQIIAYEISETLATDYVSYKPFSLGSVKEGINSRPLFKNSGAISSPTITNVVVNVDHAKNESWRLICKDDGEYEVEGTKSGVQKERAFEGSTYTSDGGEVEFYISASGEKTTKDDIFYFGTYITKPLLLTSSPVDLLIHERKLYILTKNVPSVIVFDLDTLDIENTVVFDPTSVPGRMFYNDGIIYISNLASGDIFKFNTNTQNISTISTTLPNVKYIGADDAHLFMIQNDVPKLSISDLTGTIVKTLNLNDYGNFFFDATVTGEHLGLIPNISGNVDVIDMDNIKRVDTELDDKSDFINPEFFDVGAESKPQLISVNGVSGVTQSEAWQMIFDESDGRYIVTGSKSGLQSNRVTPGETYTSDNEEISLLTRPSFSHPETEGDFFSFLTLDNIDPILISNQGMAAAGIAFDRISDGKPVGYILQQTNGQISIVDLIDYNVDKTL